MPRPNRGRGPLRKGNSSSSSTPSGVPSNALKMYRAVVNPGTAPRCTLVINMNDDCARIHANVSAFFNCLIQQCSEGCTRVLDIPVCNDNTEQPCVVAAFQIEGSTREVLIERRSFYVIALTINKKWRCTKDCEYSIPDAKPLGFYSSYQEMIRDGATVEKLGLSVLQSAFSLAMDNRMPSDFKTGYMRIAYHVAEASRFKPLRDLILGPLAAGDPCTPSLMSDVHQAYITSWKDISDALREYERSGAWNLAEIKKNTMVLEKADNAQAIMGILSRRNERQ